MSLIRSSLRPLTHALEESCDRYVSFQMAKFGVLRDHIVAFIDKIELWSSALVMQR